MTGRADVEAIVLQACRDEGARTVIDRLLDLMVPAAAILWLHGSEPHLGGTTPLVLLQLEGSRPILDALDAFEEGAFA
jgi:hypothetical protein